ncbi:MAG: Nif3-like dinuclear metal center hexameric protein [Ruminococcus sp.]|nr:Nif3-like dinuclear metal center hexameric protein [Ruminococcus sp.]
MTTINDIMKYFETFAPLATQMEFDNSGLLVGDKETAVTNVLVALDITEDVVLEAEKIGCELIISHHPVIFNPIKHMGTHNPAYLLANKGIAALCMHTNLDLGTEFGVNVALANAIGVQNPILAEIGECLFVGVLDNAVEMHNFAHNVKTALNCNGLRYTDVNNSVKTVAVSSGAGGSNVFEAAKLGADVLVTGEIKHHEINAANAMNINIIDVGHYKSEDIAIFPLIMRLSAEFFDITFTKSKSYSDFIKYV